MAITRSFGGQTLLKPGAYSVSRVDNAQSLNVGDNDTIMLIGEATNGDASVANGGTGTSRVFNSANVQSLVDYYVSGDIVDAALAAVRPSLTAGVSGPGQFVVFKTNVGALSFSRVRFDTGGTPRFPAAGEILRFQVPINASGETADVDLTYGTDISLFDSAGAAITTVEQFRANTIAAVLASPALQNFITAEEDSVAAQILFTSLKQGDQFNNIRIFQLAAGGVSFASGMGYLFDVSSVMVPAAGLDFEGGTPNLGGTTTAQLNEAFADAFNFDPNVIVPLWSNDVVAPTSLAVGSFSVTNTLTTGAETVLINLTNAIGSATQLTVNIPNATAIAGAAAIVRDALEASADARFDDYTYSGSGDNIIITAKVGGPDFNATTFEVVTGTGGLGVTID